MLEQEFKYYLKNQAELVKKYNGKFIVIKNQEVIGSYDDKATAYEESKMNHELGTFLIQLCQPGTDSHTAAYHSRASIDYA